MPKAMSFTLYRVEAEYVTPGQYAFGCGWICDTRLQAEALLAELQDTRTDLCNLYITPAHYGESIA